LQQGGETRLERTDPSGHYSFLAVLPGEYVQFVRDTQYRPWSRELVLGAGVESHDITLVARPPGGRLAGRITSATGTYAGRVVLFLQGLDDQDVWQRGDPAWREQDGQLVAEFSFEELGSGSYELRCCTTEAVRVPRRVLTLSPPDEQVHFHIEDDAPRRLHRIRASSAASGEPLESFRVFFQTEGNVELLELATREAPWEREISEGVEFEWRVFAGGFRASSGTALSFGRESELDVRLEPGFSAVVNVLSIESLRSLEGVEVFADGVSVGMTNAGGMLFLDLPERPDHITFDPSLWSIFSDGAFQSDLAPASGAFDSLEDDVYLSAYLRPMR
jgi:hypothetical protein